MEVEDKEKRVEIGSGDSVVLDKLFGPTIFAQLKIVADASRGWVVYRSCGSFNEWVEWVVIPAQLSSDFETCPMHDDAFLRCEKCGRTRTEADIASEGERAG